MTSRSKILVACEFSGVVRDSFIRAGYDAMSCDLLPSETDGPHYEGDVQDILGDGFDLMIAHPPCTYLATVGARWFPSRQREQSSALDFVKLLMAAPIPMIAIENPVSVISTRIRKPDQIINPWWFGDPKMKATCLWLKNLPPLMASLVMVDREKWVELVPNTPDRWKIRSRTFQGIADAMVSQWSYLL